MSLSSMNFKPFQMSKLWCWWSLPLFPEWGATTLKQFSPRCSKTCSKWVTLLRLSLSSYFLFSLAKKIEPTTYRGGGGGRVTFQSWEARGDWCNENFKKIAIKVYIYRNFTGFLFKQKEKDNWNRFCKFQLHSMQIFFKMVI